MRKCSFFRVGMEKETSFNSKIVVPRESESGVEGYVVCRGREPFASFRFLAAGSSPSAATSSVE